MSAKSSVGLDNVSLSMDVEAAESIWQIQRIIHLGCMANENAEFCDDLESFIQDDLDERTALLFEFTLDDYEDLDDDEMLHEFVAHCARRGYRGFLAKINFPKTTRRGNGLTPRWGICQVEWFYAEKLEEIIEQADHKGKELEITEVPNA